MAALAFLLFWAIVMFLLIEGVHIAVFGWFVDEAQLDAYLTKYLKDATLNPYSEDGTLFSNMPRFIALNRSFLCKWYVSEYGTIPRWSRWTQVIDDKRAELLMATPLPTTKKLGDL